MSDKTKCPKCGNSVASNSDFCPNCGEFLLKPIKNRPQHCPYNCKESVDVPDLLLGIALTLNLSYIGFLIAVVGFKDRKYVKNGATGTVIVITVGYVVALILFYVLKALGVFG